MPHNPVLAALAARSARAAGVQCFLAYVDEANLRARVRACGATVDQHDRSLLRLPVSSLLQALVGLAPPQAR